MNGSFQNQRGDSPEKRQIVVSQENRVFEKSKNTEWMIRRGGSRGGAGGGRGEEEEKGKEEKLVCGPYNNVLKTSTLMSQHLKLPILSAL